MVSRVHSKIKGRDVRPFAMTKIGDQAVAALAQIGIHIQPEIVHKQVAALMTVGDASFVAPITTASNATPLQFLQAWLPGFVKVLTAARKIDTCIGISTVGQWHDQEIVVGVVEPSGTAAEYGDYTNIPLASWNVNFERRTVVRGELGMTVGNLEEARASAMKLSTAEEKRQSAAIALEIMRNAIGFSGWSSGANRTYGILNDPNLPAYGTITGVWSGKAFLAICSDIRTMIATLRTQSQDQINPEDVNMVMLLPTTVVDFLSTTSDFGISVRDWLTQTYPKIRIESAPELVAANAGANAVYLYAEEIDSSIDGSTDGGDVFQQMVQSKFITLGVEKRAKSYVEDYANATAGVICKRPYAVVRNSGL